MRWGLVPFFAKGVPPKYSTINARIETVQTSPAYRAPWKRAQRCIVAIAGFYEWHTQANGNRQPFYVRPSEPGQCFALAGLWDASTSDAGESIVSCTVITMPANELLAQIHNDKQRMPAILLKEDWNTWLHGTPEEAMAALKQYPVDLMIAFPVSKRVNSPRNNDAKLIEAIDVDAVA